MSKRYALLVGTVIGALALSGCGHGQGNQGATSTQVANSVTSESASSVSTSQSSRSQSSSQSASEAKSQGASQASQEPARSRLAVRLSPLISSRCKPPIKNSWTTAIR